MKSQGLLISAFAFAVVIAVFAVINVETVEVNFLFAKTSTPLILVILVSTLLGGLTVGLFGMLRIFRLQRTVKTLEKGSKDQSADQQQSIAEGHERLENLDEDDVDAQESSNQSSKALDNSNEQSELDKG
ncbi:lipopolysaccharide assembly protein LapA domain-containing protein [Paenibacillus sp. HB172176]|uniref:LapA family protein n=1 Tax=Paenibacillus sp. HB172176 TaxID=2493690 RepID=UPI00143956D6|nr:lipopolysaccharide assembly protein LapA domain-containing protein [Paenibacillus sp. HB172176]